MNLVFKGLSFSLDLSLLHAQPFHLSFIPVVGQNTLKLSGIVKLRLWDLSVSLDEIAC